MLAFVSIKKLLGAIPGSFYCILYSEIFSLYISRQNFKAPLSKKMNILRGVYTAGAYDNSELSTYFMGVVSCCSYLILWSYIIACCIP